MYLISSLSAFTQFVRTIPDLFFLFQSSFYLYIIFSPFIILLLNIRRKPNIRIHIVLHLVSPYNWCAMYVSCQYGHLCRTLYDTHVSLKRNKNSLATTTYPPRCFCHCPSRKYPVNRQLSNPYHPFSFWEYSVVG